MRFLQKKRTIIGAIALISLLLCACGNGQPAQSPPDKINQGSITEPAPEETFPALPANGSSNNSDSTGSEATPVSTPEPTPEPTPEVTPEPRLPRVEDSYFADAAFFGNSLVDGLHCFGGLEHGDFFAGTSASVISVETTKDARLSSGESATLLDALLEKQYGKIYILLGINELGFNTQSFVSIYADLLATIQAEQPEAELFIMSLTPITQRRSDSEDLFTREKVLEFNTAIETMAAEQGYTYMDLYAAFADENGWLPPEKSTDGVHFTADTYLEWAEYMRTHYDGC